jgi:hypothetical protein
VKLRKARVIPIGWEIAAESSANSESDPVTLQEVMDGFYECNDDGERDSEHPWCHLVDPNWVLKFPETQCRTLAYGQLLSSAGTDERQEECVDMQSCIAEDEYASCQTFVDADGVEVDFLTNTLDYGDCGAGNVDCLWYATVQEEDTDGAFDWPDVPSAKAADEDPDTYKERLYFNGDVQECDEDEGGCQELIIRNDSLRLNEIANGSFEVNDDNDAWPDTWFLSGADYDTENGEGRTGDAAVSPGTSGIVYKYGVVLQQSRFYTFSFYAKQPSEGSTNNVTAAIFLSDDDGNDVDLTGTSYTTDNCEIVDYVGDGAYEAIQITAATPESSSYERFDCTFTTPTLSSPGDIHAIVDFFSGEVWIDDVQLEQAEDTSRYHVAYNASTVLNEYVKIAPSYLGCTGEATDPEACDDYAPMCGEQEAGCSLYTPTNGDPSVSAVVSELDTCPAVCSGYDTYRQEATLYEPDGEFPVYFIPSTAESCNEDAVGCDEFTNLETEETEYFTYLRACVTEEQADANTGGDQMATFYTWEGSDEEGFQLKTWNLLESDLDGYANITHADSGEVDDEPGAAPCTNWEMNSDGTGIECDDAEGGTTIVSDTDECDEYDDIIDNPDCREFYDSNGDVHYRAWSETVTVNNACVTYRKTDVVGADASAQQDTCEHSGGYFDTETGQCRYFGYDEESTTCAERDAGCRNYTGGRSANSRVALQDVFEDGTLENWDAVNASDIEYSNESVATDGHSLKSDGASVWTYQYEEVGGCTTEGGCASSTGTLGGSCTVLDGEEFCGTLHGQLFTEKTYTLSFWAKGDTNVSVGFDIDYIGSGDPSVDVFFDSAAVELDSSWQQYSVGPLDMNAADYEDFGDGTVLAFKPSSTTGTFYIDNVVLREGEDNITVIKDSWVTPAVCDENAEGETSAQAQLGCQEYTDQDGDTVYLKSFRRLCDEDKVGCDAYFQTNQSESAYVEVYNATCYNVDEVQTCNSGICSESGDTCAADSDCNTATWEEGSTASEKTSCHVFTSDDGSSFDEDSPVLCSIAAGEQSCQFDFTDWYIPEHLLGSEQTLYHIAYGPDATIVPADEAIYAVVTSEHECTSAGAGCQELGQPVFSADQSAVDDWETVYLLNRPDDYSEILCSHDALFCEEWDAGSDGTWYFRNPGDHLCEYKTDVTINGATYDGWFREGTTEFCYGTGTCSDDSAISCSTDADCYDTTTGTDSGSCTVDTGSYLIGGDQSGIWRNGDDDYDGWVGTCTAEYDSCTEFLDPLDYDDDEFYGDTEGEAYHYLDNNNLTETSLLTSQQCNGQVSQEEGCSLFNDTGDTNLDYNAGASYMSSAHADELHGGRPFELVDPIDCELDAEDTTITTQDGEEVDLCAQRCVWENEDLNSSYTISTGDPLNTVYTVGSSCFTDNDCATAESDTGDLVQGTCETEVTNSFGGTVTLDRLENDTNRVLKVTRDRVCSEWLTCSSSYTVWDDSINSYRTVCDGIDLCTNYSGDSSASFCSSWDSDDPAAVLDQDRYVARDVSWYGEEYSGYAVPDMFPIQHLSQINIATPAGVCDDDSGSSYGETCDDDDDCGSGTCVVTEEQDFRLGFSAGACEENHGSSCTIGYCESTGSGCASDSDCTGTDSCVTGTCYVVSTDTCSEDSDCATGECLAGTCVEESGSCDTDYACADPTATCFSSEAAKDGTCYRGSCFVSLDGDEFDADVNEAMICRAQPEIDSPFSTEVVEDWVYLEFGTDATTTHGSTETELKTLSSAEAITLDDIIGSDKWDIGTDNEYGGFLPGTFRSGFSSANTCVTGEDCTCNYTRLSDSSGQSQYIAVDTGIASSRSDEGIHGICSSDSPVAGAVCGDHDDCRVYDASLAGPDGTVSGGYRGSCEPITFVQDYYGLEGYCLERDSGLNIDGSSSTGACLTWFPVDQLAGSTDLYAKYKSAGWFQDTYACTATRPFVTLYTSDIAGDNQRASDKTGSDEQGIACAESSGGVTESNSYDRLTSETDGCYQNVFCPDGYYAIAGQPNPKNNDSWDQNHAQDCVEKGTSNANDCPYICVPWGSVHADGGDAICAPPTESEFTGSTGDADVQTLTSTYGTTVYTWVDNTGDVTDVAQLRAFDDVIESYADCQLTGIDWKEVSDVLDYDHTDTGTSLGTACYYGAGNNYRCLFLNYDIYPGCSELIQVSDADEGYAFTNKLYVSEDALDSGSAFSYTRHDTYPAPYGMSVLSPDEVDNNLPVRVVACTTDGYVTDVTDDPLQHQAGNYIEIAHDANSCSGTAEYPLDIYEDGAHDYDQSPEARSYIDFSWTGVYTSPNYEWDTDSFGDGSEGKGSVFERLTQIFSRIDLSVNDDGFVFRWDDDDWDEESPDSGPEFGYDEIGWDDVADATGWDPDDYTIDVREEGTAPTVWSVDVNDCGSLYCSEGTENKITVNNQDDGDIEADGGFIRASVKFFAAADKEQLPLRRVIVDWSNGEESGSPDDDNYYKNSRGLQDGDDGGEDSDTNSKCALESEWGLTPASCNPNYFSYTHTYRCSASDLTSGELPSCTDVTNDDGDITEACQDGTRCVYQPRVHVRDNWGWCAGECEAGNGIDVDDSGGCFDGTVDALSNPTDENSECAYQTYPTTILQTVDPWVYYDGLIYVTP